MLHRSQRFAKKPEWLNFAGTHKPLHRLRGIRINASAILGDLRGVALRLKLF
jgi:hypothetical protein